MTNDGNIHQQTPVLNESDPRSDMHYLGSSENKAWKNSGLYGIWTHDLCDTGAALYQLS